MITNEEFFEATEKFDEYEKRANFYRLAIDLVDNGFEFQAYLIILAIWNSSRFQFTVRNFAVDNVIRTIEGLNPYYETMQNEHFATINFDRYKKEIKTIYSTLSRIKGIEYTGASKVMHIKNRNVFVMWDEFIRGQKPKKYYKNLAIMTNGWWKYQEYDNDAGSYLKFLKNMQGLFRNISFSHPEKTFAKAIDEFNYVNVTLEIQKMKKEGV